MTAYALVMVLQRNRTKEGTRESYFKELSNVIVGASKSELCRASARGPGKSWCCLLYPKAGWRQNSLFLGGPPSVLIRPLVDQMRPTHIVKGNLSSESADLNVNHT